MIRIRERGIDGFLHQANGPSRAGLVLTHGAGGNCESGLLIAVAEAFRQTGVSLLRCNLPFRQQRRSGPPFPAQAAADREGLREAVNWLRKKIERPVLLGGHSYGGRQASMLAAEDPDLVSGLLLLSYPLHPPNKPAQLRSEHFPRLRTPVLFVHGSKDPFGSVEELKSAMQLIPAKNRLLQVEGAGHDLKREKVPAEEIVAEINSGTGLFCTDLPPQRRDILLASD